MHHIIFPGVSLPAVSSGVWHVSIHVEYHTTYHLYASRQPSILIILFSRTPIYCHVLHIGDMCPQHWPVVSINTRVVFTSLTFVDFLDFDLTCRVLIPYTSHSLQSTLPFRNHKFINIIFVRNKLHNLPLVSLTSYAFCNNTCHENNCYKTVMIQAKTSKLVL